ncbi:hypothetical protein [Fusobacterium pseudoperiodonticum]|uniref:Uncharacterized protein n=1 Tax=Fusobacterium pseudoperiodonticum TaxID=2663009 RepID=A0A2G9EJ68_9FUSO|nr:hypothetical protein [Fusobacterium pseudoperiodonticum]PIM80701.1 hypothetical protein CTM71_10160 [Fusobacterium pseudoperiodonticum]
MNKDFDNNIPILTKKKEILKVILVLFFFFLAFLGFGKYHKAPFPLLIGIALLLFILLLFLVILVSDIYFIIRMIKYRDNTVVPEEFQISPPKRIFMLIILIILSVCFTVYIILESIMNPSENVFQKFKYPICLIIISILIYNIYKAGRYSIDVMEKNIRILFKNQEISSFNVENVAFVKFSGAKNKVSVYLIEIILNIFVRHIDSYRRSYRNEDELRSSPFMRLFDFKGKEFFKTSLSIKDYWLMKKYFLKYNVKTKDISDFLNDDL